MKAEILPTQRKFDSARDEMNYLYHKVLYWLYDRKQPRRAAPFADRLERLLKKESPGHDAIFPEECRSLIHEQRGDFRGAIRHREKEIRLIKRLQKICRGQAYESYALQGYGPDDLSDRLDLLAILYHDKGDLAKALAVLRESKQLCEKHGIPFDGQDVWEEYLAESKGLDQTG